MSSSVQDNRLAREVDRAIRRLEERGFFTDIESVVNRKMRAARERFNAARRARRNESNASPGRSPDAPR